MRYAVAIRDVVSHDVDIRAVVSRDAGISDIVSVTLPSVMS